MEEIIDKISKIFKLSIDVDTYTNHNVFVDYSGHVNKLTVYYYKNGWNEQKARNTILEVYIDASSQYQLHEELDEALSILEQLLEDENEIQNS